MQKGSPLRAVGAVKILLSGSSPSRFTSCTAAQVPTVTCVVDNHYRDFTGWLQSPL